jgi:hypothetical protein
MSTVLLQTTAEPAEHVTWLDISTGLMIPLVVALIAAGIAILVHVREERSQRRDRLRDVFSEALRAVADYQELPYMVRRRSDAQPMTREDLTRHASDVQSRLDFYVARLELESGALGDAYGRLVSTIRRESGAQMTTAWKEERLDSDVAVPLGASYERSAADAERRRCVAVMRRHLGTDVGDSSDLAPSDRVRP